MEEKAIKPATFSTIRVLIIFAAMALSISLFVYVLTDGAETRQLFTSTVGVADMVKTSESEILLEYKVDDFYAYFLRTKNEIQPKAMIKKIGLWVYSYPSTNNLQGITPRGDDLYFYQSVPANQAQGVRLLSSEAGIIEPQVQKNVKALGGNQMIFVFKIENYAAQPSDYLLQLLDDQGQVVSHSEADFENAIFTLIQYENNLGEFASRKFFVKNGENQERWPAVFQATQNSLLEATLLTEQEWDATKPPTAIHTVIAEIDCGLHLTIYGPKQYFVWRDLQTNSVLIDSGEGALMIHSEQNYREIDGSQGAKSLALGKFTSAYRLKTAKELFSLFAWFQE